MFKPVPPRPSRRGVMCGLFGVLVAAAVDSGSTEESEPPLGMFDANRGIARRYHDTNVAVGAGWP